MDDNDLKSGKSFTFTFTFTFSFIVCHLFWFFFPSRSAGLVSISPFHYTHFVCSVTNGFKFFFSPPFQLRYSRISTTKKFHFSKSRPETRTQVRITNHDKFYKKYQNIEFNTQCPMPFTNISQKHQLKQRRCSCNFITLKITVTSLKRLSDGWCPLLL